MGVARVGSGVASARERAVIRKPGMIEVVATVGIFASVIGIAAAGGYFESELAVTPDEGAHFVSGTLIFDYLRSGFHQAPLDFAIDYYQHYPKIGIGQWPPLFYVLQAAWYAVFGAQPWSLVLLTVAITATTASLLFQSIRSRHGIALSALVTALFLLNPLVRRWTVLANADMLLALVSLVAVLALIRFLNSGGTRDAAAWLVAIVIAVGVKWNGLALLLAPPLAIVLARDLALFRKRRVWLMLLAVAGTLLIIPFAAVGFGFTGFGSGAASVAGFLAIAAHPFERLPFLKEALHIVAPGVLGLAAIGTWHMVTPRVPVGREQQLVAAAAVGWIVAVLVFHVISPVTGESRYLLPCVVAAHLLCAEGAALLRLRWPDWRGGLVVGGAAASLLLVDPQAVVLRYGYREAARLIPTHIDQQPAVVLIASDSVGESAFTAHRRAVDVGRESFVLRGFTTLASDDWHGQSYQLRFTSPDEIRAYLQRIPVNFIVVDRQPQTASPAHLQLLMEALSERPAEFPVYQTLPFRIGRATVPDALVVYRNAVSTPASVQHLRSVIPVPRGFQR